MTNPASSAPEPVFIDFEGIDGSGKTTLSNRLADYLKECGVAVHHARDKGVFRSEISKAIRTLTRDPRFLRMSDVTEFLLYTARDTQMIDEFIRPNLQPGNIVFSDRYLYSAITHSHHARGLDRELVDSVLKHAARGLWPDLVVYCDVDPLTSRLRKKIQKIKDCRPAGDFGRKGLMGIGFREQMRTGFLELAEENSEGWLVIDNANSTIEESLQRIFNRVREILERKGYGDLPNPRWADNNVGSTLAPNVLGESVTAMLALPSEEERKARVASVFYGELDRLTPKQAAFAALYICGLNASEATDLRQRIVKEVPEIVAYGLQGVRDPEGMDLREALCGDQPLYVARSLSGMMMDPRACALREKLVKVQPGQIALAVRGSDSEHAWALRKRINKLGAKAEVLQSIRGIDTDVAWEIRDKRTKERFFSALLDSIGGIDTDRAWVLRDQLSEEYLPWVLMSLRGLDSDRAWDLRLAHVERAPKIVIKTIGRSSDPRAWELREAAKFLSKEVLDSLSGLDSSQAWKLRLELQKKWPNTCVSSLGAGAQSERAWNFRWDMLGSHPSNMLLLKHLYKAAQRNFAEDVEFEDDEDDDLT